MASGLKLRAADAEDMHVVSACMQDALVACNDFSFMPGPRRFVMIAQRFRWENCPDFLQEKKGGRAADEPCRSYERVKSILVFDDVTGLRLADLSPVREADLLELLAIDVENPGAEAAGSATVTLFFAGGGTIRLEVERLLCHLEDLGRSWPTARRPRHPVDDAE